MQPVIVNQIKKNFYVKDIMETIGKIGANSITPTFISW